MSEPTLLEAVVRDRDMLRAEVERLREVVELKDDRKQSKRLREYAAYVAQFAPQVAVDLMCDAAGSLDAFEAERTQLRNQLIAIGNIVDGTVCQWSDEDTCWDTGCGECYTMIEGTPESNGIKFCPFCGGHVEVSGGEK